MVAPATIVAASAVVFNDDHEILLIRRGRPPNAGLWSLPGGKVKTGESPATAAVREVFEETSLVVNVDELVDIIERTEGDSVYQIWVYLARFPDSKTAPRAGHDAAAARWVRQSAIGSLSVTAGLVDVIDVALSRHWQKP